MLFVDPVVSALVGWLVSMTTRQAGHFFFEPKGYDHVNQATHEHKEEIKVGYNLQRKVVLMAIWALSPLVLLLDPDAVRPVRPWATAADFIRQVAKIWLAVGIGGLLFRTVHLFFIRDVQTGLVWMTKILTDPFNDLKLYYKAPLAAVEGRTDRPRPREARQARVRVACASTSVMPGLAPGITSPQSTIPGMSEAANPDLRPVLHHTAPSTGNIAADRRPLLATRALHATAACLASIFFQDLPA